MAKKKKKRGLEVIKTWFGMLVTGSVLGIVTFSVSVMKTADLLNGGVQQPRDSAAF